MPVKLSVYGHFYFWAHQPNAKKINVAVSNSVSDRGIFFAAHQ
jgi:hypothetical protein